MAEIQAAATPEAKPKPKPQRDPFGEPLDPGTLREFFRRFYARPQAEQEAFIARVNWNLLDQPTEHRVIEWMITNLRSGEAARIDFVLAQLEKQPHPRRGRHAVRFRQVKAELPEPLQKRLADVFGPVLGGAPKRPGFKAQQNRPQPQAAPAAPREATSDDLSKLKDFFGKFGGAR